MNGGCGEVRTPDIRLVRAKNQMNFNSPQLTMLSFLTISH